MTKALVCAKCFDIRGLDPNGGFVTCFCGSSSARWEDAAAGKVRCRGSWSRILGLNNNYFVPAIAGPSHLDTVEAGGQWEWWRKLHDRAVDAKGYIFDRERRSCWATIVRVNETNDVRWEDENE